MIRIIQTRSKATKILAELTTEMKKATVKKLSADKRFIDEQIKDNRKKRASEKDGEKQAKINEKIFMCKMWNENKRNCRKALARKNHVKYIFCLCMFLPLR